MIVDPLDKTQQSWVELMIIMKDCNDRLFPSRDQTTKLVQNEAYILHFNHLRPLLHSWLKRFNALDRESHMYVDRPNLANGHKSPCCQESFFRLSIIISVSSCTPTTIIVPP